MGLVRALEDIRKTIAESEDDYIDRLMVERLSYHEISGDLVVEYHGSRRDAYVQLLECLSSPAISNRLLALSLTGPDEGANGTRNWDLEPLVPEGVGFPKLRRVEVQGTQIGDHNHSIVGSVYDEEGVIGRLVRSAPVIEELRVPSAPALNFFECGYRPIRRLSVDIGYAHQDFVQNFARHSKLSDLKVLEWGDFAVDSSTEYYEYITPWEQYVELFQSPAFRSVRRFIWRNPSRGHAEIQELKKHHPRLDLFVVRTSRRRGYELVK